MNQINTVEQFAAVISDTFTSLMALGNIVLPCPAPQPWNNRAFNPTFEADRGGRSIVPDWRFSCYPEFSRDGAIMRFAGLKVSVNVADATMHGYNRFVRIASLDQVASAIAELVAFRDQHLNACKHLNHSHVANLGRCYNRYKCNDCGATFEIDSGD